MKRFIAIILSIILAIGTITIYGASSSEADKDGDIGTWPSNWNELFTTTDSDQGKTEEPVQTTTTERTTTKKIEPKKGKVISATRKSKKSMKAKITLKKIKGSKGYQIQISANKKFNKILVKKNTKKWKITINSKKLKNKRKLYVRARAYILNNKKKTWGRWSSKKIIKIKKK